MEDNKYIDFHSHILPNIDNGSRTIDETQNMLIEAKEAGFSTIISTPYFIPNIYETENYSRDIWLKALKQKFCDIDNIELINGSEVNIEDNVYELIKWQKASTINYSSYCLISINEKKEDKEIIKKIRELKDKNITPIIAHPEKCKYIQKDPCILEKYIDHGCLVQANYGSFIGEHGKRVEITAKNLLINNMIHFLGTDAHREKTIYKQVPDAIVEIKKLIGENEFKKLAIENPQRVLKNKKIDLKKIEDIDYSFGEKIIINFVNAIKK